jgi:hypothetical protein
MLKQELKPNVKIDYSMIEDVEPSTQLLAAILAKNVRKEPPNGVSKKRGDRPGRLVTNRSFLGATTNRERGLSPIVMRTAADSPKPRPFDGL